MRIHPPTHTHTYTNTHTETKLDNACKLFVLGSDQQLRLLNRLFGLQTPE